MKYEQEILASFEKLGKKPRGNQLEYINKIIESYLDKGMKNVIISAPTGSGKSIIGAIVADVMHTLTNDDDRCASFILMGTNVLVEQYADTFKGNKDFILVKGSNNYECPALSEPFEQIYADNCCSRELYKSDDLELNKIAQQFCNPSKCQFAYIKKAKHVVNHLITNYSYFFIDRLFTKQHSVRTITVWDEAHTVNDAFAEHCAVYVSNDRLTKLTEEMANILKLPDINILKSINEIKTAIKNGSINDGNYFEYLDKIYDIYKYVKDVAEERAAESLKTDLKASLKFSKLAKKYTDMNCKIGDLVSYMYEHIFEIDTKKEEFTIKPIFVGNMFSVLENTKYQLFMSGTVSDKMMYETLNLDPKNTEFIKMPPVFNINNKKIIFYNIDKLNYSTMKDEKVQNKLIKACVKLTNQHIEQGESGIILTPSFDVTEMIANQLDVKIHQHKRGTKLADVVEKFKKCNEPSVLLSPSMFEGISLDDDLSRFQIFIKAPYASLAEKRMKYIAEYHKDFYTLQTILKVIQGAGRSVRNENDVAVTYMLDSMLSFLFKNPLNAWKDEFSASYKTLI